MRRLVPFLVALPALLPLFACGAPQLSEFLSAPVPVDEPVGENGELEPDAAQQPYEMVLSLYDYIEPGSEPDEVVDGKPFYYVYLWLPRAVPELGVRAIAPVRNYATPESGDVTTPAWEAGQDDFDTESDIFITYERADIYSEGDIPNADSVPWRRVAWNDDSEEVIAHPSGENLNALLRVTDGSELTVGLVRIGITDYKNEEFAGTYLVQVGIRDKNLERAILARSHEELYEKLQAAPEN